MGKIIYKGIGYGGGGNSNTGDFVDVDLIQVTGTKIATININNEPNDLYAPGGVSDVKVNNVSVLSGDVAEIDLTGYATSSDLNGKQDSLTPGTNITIDQNNVISATGGSEVEANPQGTATDALNTVDIDGTIYTIEGTPVEANPAGAATADLTKIGINNIIYDLATGNTDYTELTQAQYNALTPAQKNNGTLYFITDAIAGGDGDVAAELLTETEYAALTTEQKTNGLIYFVKEDAGSSSTVRKIYYMNLEFGSTGGGGGGNVADVYVNGVSALDANDIAQIKTHKILTQTAYDNLSQAEKDDDIIYFIQPSSLSNYEFHESLDGTCIVRINETENEHLWFFKNFYKDSGDVIPPAELSEYVPSILVLAPNYPNGGSIQDGWVGFYNNNVRSWTQDKQSLTTGYFYGVIDLDDTTQEQSIPYFDPYDIGSREYKIYYKGIEYTKNNIEDLANVNVSSVANGQILKYNSTTQKWENANESGGGGIDNYYLRNGIIAKASPAAYTSCLLDKPMDNGDYKYIINDNNTETTGFFTWAGSTLNLSLSGKTLQITATTAGLTYYSGNWRDITCDIKRLDGAVIDENVLQTATNLDANYEVLFSESADNTTKTEGARKSNLLIFNPSTGRLQSTQFYCLNGYSNCILKGDSLYFGGNSSLETELTKSGLEVSYGNNRTMQVTYNDINLVGGIDTWDGTNTSLKTALQDILNRLTTLEGGNV